ncbi:MAG: copper resistance protein B [Longimicrobiales bacterium]
MRRSARRPVSRRGRLGAATLALAAMTAAAVPATAQTMDDMNYLFVMVDEFESAPGLAGNPLLLSAEGWYGGDYARYWFKLEGEAEPGEGAGFLSAQALYSRLVSPYFEFQAGVRLDRQWGDGGLTRPHAVVGFQGLAPYWFEIETALFVDHEGNVSAGFDASYDILLTQRAIVEPSLTVGLALQDVPEWGIATGLHELELGARLRYEIRREFAPYVGVAWHASFGGTADAVRAGGGAPRDASLVAGLRVWY